MLSQKKPKASFPPKKIELENYKTKGEGDCAFHAVFGEWDEEQRQFACEKVTKIRKEIAEKIRTCKKGDPIYPAVKDAIDHLIRVGDYNGKEIQAARKLYHLYLQANQHQVLQAWGKFEEKIARYPEVKTYIEENAPTDLKNKKLKDKFLGCLNVNDGELYGIILSISELQKEFKNYNEESVKDFNYDDLLKKEGLLNEYAELMTRTRALGKESYWLLPSELSLIAYTFDITIKLYGMDKGVKRKIETYNPGKTVHQIYFNGADHYEKMANKGKFKGATNLGYKSHSLNSTNNSLQPKKDPKISQVSPLIGTGEYESSGLKKSLHGNIYQLKLLMLFLKRGLQYPNYQLATEMDSADKFDDVVFRYKIQEKDQEKYIYRYLQAKHKYEDTNKITENDLLTESDDEFSLQKYFISYQKIKEKFKDGVLKEFTICTNIDFDYANDKNSDQLLRFKEVLEEIKEKDDILSVEGPRKAIRYRFKKGFKGKGKDKLYEVIKGSELFKLCGKLVECITDSKKELNLRSPIFQVYHVALVKEVIDKKNKKFNQKFIDNDDSLSKSAQAFRMTLFKQLAKEKNIAESDKDYEQKLKRILSDRSFKISPNFGSSSEGINDKLPGSENISDQEIEEFLEHLVFAVNQPNEVELGLSIAEEVGGQYNLINGDLVASYFQKEMLDWMKYKKGKFLTHKNAKDFFEIAGQKVNQLVLTGPTLEYQTILDKHEIKFSKEKPVQEFLNAKEQILCLSTLSSTFLTSVKVYSALKEIEKYQKTGSYIFIDLKSVNNLLKPLCEAFKSEGTDLLIIECGSSISNNNAQDLVKMLEPILKNYSHKKMIFIAKKNHALVNVLMKMEGKSLERQDVSSEYDDFSKESKKALKERVINFQGQDTVLKDLVSEDALHQVLKGASLVEFIHSENLNIDPEREILDIFERECYIPRTLQRATQFDKTCLENITDLLLISGIHKPDLEKEVDSIDIADVLAELSINDAEKEHAKKYWVLPRDEEEAEQEFREIVIKNNKRSIHWLVKAKDNEHFIWKKTHGSVTGLKKYVLDEEENKKALKINDQFLLLAAEPGMGKSILISLMAEKAKKDNTAWSIRIDLKTHKHLLNELNVASIADVIHFISEALRLSAFGKSLLEYYVKSDKRVSLYIDGFDEISLDEQENVIKILQIFKRNLNPKQIVIATRRHLLGDLENALGILSYKLKPFSLQDQKDYLILFWGARLGIDFQKKGNKERANIFAEKICTLFASSMHDKTHSFLGVPLQARLLAESFQGDFKNYFNEDEGINLPEKLDIVDLYQRFKNAKYTIYFGEKEEGLPFLKKTYKKHIESLITRTHHVLALQLLFPNFLQLFPDSAPDELLQEDDINRIGIVQTKDNTITFIHRTFSEYFIADMLVEYLKKPENDPHHQNTKAFLLLHIFKASNFVIYNFIELMVEKEQNEYLRDIWKNITHSVLNKIELNLENDKERIHITEYIADAETCKPLMTEERIMKGLSEFFDSAKYNRQVDQNGISTFFKDFYQAVIQITDIDLLEQMLVMLSYIAKNHNFNKLKEAILSRVDEVIQHYLSQILVQDNGKKIKYELLESFSNISANTNTGFYGQVVANRVSGEVEGYKKTLIVYKRLNTLSNKEDLNLEEGITKEKVLMMRIKNTLFTKNQLIQLFSWYPDWQKKESFFKDIFVELLLQIKEKNAQIVKLFLIKREEYTVLIKLFNKFPDLRLANEEVDTIFNKKSLFILERIGVKLGVELKFLSLNMANYFIRVLEEKDINGYHASYARTIFIEMILKMIDTVNFSTNHHVDKTALIYLFARVVQFASEHSLSISLNTNQLEMMCKLIQDILNHTMLSEDMLFHTIEALMMISQSLKLKIINAKDPLIIVEPASGFSYELKLKHKEDVKGLLLISIQEPREKLILACNKAISKMFPSENVFMYSYKSLLSQHKPLDMHKKNNDKKHVRSKSF